ncbi:hypothetical protein AS033_08265 [Exiguobacterium indicum]|uniref:DUF445 domain-containing protein n=1 Tax=Exiguobacterium indicum TaxID=296995 RepID=A0A0V8GGW2_9BACL|nr:DUF445 domain-containing protein [Exiguobacterium enclense]KSU49350.1 hypothetical protein AS033_08265 [Exiguobacterium enclense]SDC55304.1 Uncharacterized membrane-anchored protein YjiN, DUF445 family [Exiguobacterium enclense]
MSSLEQPKTSTRRLATVSLIFMAVGFVVSLPFKENAWVFWLQSGFEAGLVGGIADWFAITALFRHPLGLKIPHTNLLPKNRERVIESIVHMLETDLLNKESIVAKLQHMTLADRVIKVLRSILVLPAFRATVTELLIGLIRKLPKEAILEFANTRVTETIKAYPSKRLAVRAMQLNEERRLDEWLMDQLLDYGQRLLEDPVIRDQIGRLAYTAMIDQEKNTFLRVTARTVQKVYSEEKLSLVIQGVLLTVIQDMRHVHHPNRLAILDHLRRNLAQLSIDEERLAKIDAWKASEVDRFDFVPVIERAYDAGLIELERYLTSDAFWTERAMPMLSRALDDWEQHPTFKDSSDQWMKEQLVRFVEQNHQKIGGLVRENLNRFDTETLIHMIEDKVGSDLQWIRVNGALCGFIIGLILGAIKVFVG